VAIVRGVLLGQPAALDRVTEQLRQPRDHPPHAGRIAVHQRGHRVQRVEQKVWIELHPQCIETRVRQLRAQLRRLLKPALVAEVVIPREAGREHGQIHEQLIDKAEPRDLAQR